MIRESHGRTSALSVGFAILYIALVSVGAAVFFPAVCMAIRYFNSDPVMSLVTLSGAIGWVASIVWFTRTFKIKPKHQALDRS